MIEHLCEQLSDEWWELHRGRPTASSFSKILTPKTCKVSAQAEDYICELIASKYAIDLPRGGFENDHTRNGINTEPEARRWYEMECGEDVRQVGFVTTDDGRFGCSPDGLVGEDGGLELKCPSGKVHVAYSLVGGLPDEYKAQVHGCLVVTGRSWWDFCSYHPGLPPLRVRVTRNSYTDLLQRELDTFWGRYQDKLNQFNGVGLRDALSA